MDAERLRAFVALPLPEAVRAHLAEVQGVLRGEFPDRALRYTKPEQFHLTLRFLGNITSWQAEAVAALLQRIAEVVPRFALETGGLGAFPGPHRPSALWLGVAGDVAALHNLQGRLEHGLQDLDLIRGTGNFRPHLTLARAVGLSPTLRREVAGLLGRGIGTERMGWTVDRVQLMRSRLAPQGATYTLLAEAELTGT